MKNNYYTIISETYKAYIGRYPKSHTVEYLMTEIENKVLRESLEVFKKEGLTAFRKKSPILKECEGANSTNE